MALLVPRGLIVHDVVLTLIKSHVPILLTLNPQLSISYQSLSLSLSLSLTTVNKNTSKNSGLETVLYSHLQSHFSSKGKTTHFSILAGQSYSPSNGKG